MLKSAMWFCFGVMAAVAIAFAIALFFVVPPKRPTVEPKPAAQTHQPAPIVDGPAYLESKKTAEQLEDELAKDQANSVERPGMAGQPHDDGNGIAVDPDTVAATRAVSPNAVASGLSVVPGAIVCADLQTVSMMFHWYAEHWEDQVQDAMTNGQSRLIRSDTPAPVMPPGCALLPAGTPLEVKMVNGIPVVHAKLTDGSTIKGVTLGGMVSNH